MSSVNRRNFILGTSSVMCLSLLRAVDQVYAQVGLPTGHWRAVAGPSQTTQLMIRSLASFGATYDALTTQFVLRAIASQTGAYDALTTQVSLRTAASNTATYDAVTTQVSLRVIAN